MAAPAQVLTAGVVAVDTPKKSSSRRVLGILLLILRPLVSGYRSSATFFGGGGGRAEGKSANPPRLGRCQQRGTKVETAVILFIVFAVGLCGKRQGWWWGIKHKLSPGSIPGPGLCSIVSIFSFYLRRSSDIYAPISPIVDISFETLCLVIIFSIMIITDSILSHLLSNLTLLLFFLTLIILLEQTFFKLSVITASILSKENEHLTSY